MLYDLYHTLNLSYLDTLDISYLDTLGMYYLKMRKSDEKNDIKRQPGALLQEKKTCLSAFVEPDETFNQSSNDDKNSIVFSTKRL